MARVRQRDGCGQAARRQTGPKSAGLAPQATTSPQQAPSPPQDGPGPVPQAPGPSRLAPAKVWEGRLGTRTAREVEEYTTSYAVDRRLFAEDIEGSLAHARMLREVALISAADHRAIRAGLRTVRDELERGDFSAAPADEDIHTAVERRLHELIGPAAGRLHTGRSRNDQVATDVRLWCRRRIVELMLACARLQEALLARAGEHRHTPVPGYTHTQRAQVVSLAHHLLAYVEMLQRDVERLGDGYRRCDVLPLGSGALAGTTLPIDRRITQRVLGFAALSGNSLDAVSDRDFVVELVSSCALLMVHLSRFAEEIVLWTTAEFGFAELPTATPPAVADAPEEEPGRPRAGPGPVRPRDRRPGGVAHRPQGAALAYNRDLQEDKEPLFDAVDTLSPASGSWPTWSGGCASTPPRCGAPPPTRCCSPPTSRSTWWRGGCPSARPTSWSGPRSAAASPRADSHRPQLRGVAGALRPPRRGGAGALRRRCGAAPPRAARRAGPALGRPRPHPGHAPGGSDPQAGGDADRLRCGEFRSAPGPCPVPRGCAPGYGRRSP